MSMPTGAVIIVGMHRSGTSLVSRLLGELGVFMGADLNRHAESNAFLDLNSRVFRLGHGDWDVPAPVTELLATERVVADLMRLIETEEWSALERQYLGQAGFSLLRRQPPWPSPWGWKDPRTSITLPLWRRCLPGARVVHVYRNPADVAISLATREQARYQIRLDRWTLRSLRCLDKELGVRLWADYVGACLAARESWDREAWLDLCYEDLLTAPTKALQQLLDFLPAGRRHAGVESLVGKVDAARAYAFMGGAQAAWGEQTIRTNGAACELGYPERLAAYSDNPEAAGVMS